MFCGRWDDECDGRGGVCVSGRATQHSSHPARTHADAQHGRKGVVASALISPRAAAAGATSAIAKSAMSTTALVAVAILKRSKASTVYKKKEGHAISHSVIFRSALVRFAARCCGDSGLDMNVQGLIV